MSMITKDTALYESALSSGTNIVQETESDIQEDSIAISNNENDLSSVKVYPYNLYTDDWGAEYRAEFIQAVPLKDSSFGLLYKISLRGRGLETQQYSVLISNTTELKTLKENIVKFWKTFIEYNR